MITHREIQDACRTLLDELVVCTTGAIPMSATATGYVRTSRVLTASYTRANSVLTVGNADTAQVPIVPDGGVVGILNNEAYAVAVTTSGPLPGNSPYYWYETTISNARIGYTIGSLGSAFVPFILFRVVDISNCLGLACYLSAGVPVIAFVEKVAGAHVIPAPACAEIPYTPVAGDRLEVECNGSALTAYVNGVAVLTYTSTYLQTETKHGLQLNLGGGTAKSLTMDAVGSFLDDGFAVGMELTPSGFTTNPADTITAVTDTTITVVTARTAQGSGTGRSLTVGRPSRVAEENEALEPDVRHPYLEEQYLPGSTVLNTIGPNGIATLEPMYAPRIFVPRNTGKDAAARYADAILALFAMKTRIDLPTGTTSDALRVRGDVGPFRSQLLQNAKGTHATIAASVPLRCFTTNSL